MDSVFILRQQPEEHSVVLSTSDIIYVYIFRFCIFIGSFFVGLSFFIWCKSYRSYQLPATSSGLQCGMEFAAHIKLLTSLRQRKDETSRAKKKLDPRRQAMSLSLTGWTDQICCWLLLCTLNVFFTPFRRRWGSSFVPGFDHLLAVHSLLLHRRSYTSLRMFLPAFPARLLLASPCLRMASWWPPDRLHQTSQMDRSSLAPVPACALFRQLHHHSISDWHSLPLKFRFTYRSLRWPTFPRLPWRMKDAVGLHCMIEFKVREGCDGGGMAIILWV